MTQRIVVLSFVLLAAGLAWSAPDLGSFGGVGTRAEVTWIVYEGSGGGFQPLGYVVLCHGQPEWKSEYNEKFDEMTKGNIWRFGSNSWTTLDANVPLRFGDKVVPAGVYYLAIARTEDDRWSLVLYEPSKAHAKGALPSPEMIRSLPKAHEVPLEHGKWEGTNVERLSVEFKRKAKEHTTATLSIGWGSHRLTAPVELKLPTAEK